MGLMNKHLPHPPALPATSSPFRRRSSSVTAQRTFLGLRGKAYGPLGQILPVWAMWMSGATAEVALEDAIENVFTSAGWTIDLPGLGHFALTLESRRGTTCRVELQAVDVDQRALATAGLRH